MISLPLAEIATRAEYSLARLNEYDDERWLYIGLAAALALVFAFVGFMYRRDSSELNPWVGYLLTALRGMAFLGIALYFLHPEKRSVREIAHNSQVLFLVDTSQSMGLRDVSPNGDSVGTSRIDQVTSGLAGLLADVRQRHDVTVHRFDRETSRVVTLPRQEDDLVNGTSADHQEEPFHPEEIDWKTTLVLQGNETRLAASLRKVIHDHVSDPIAGVVLISDGRQNAGPTLDSALALAKEAEVPIFPIGVGSERSPVNVGIVDFVAPARAYPHDTFSVAGYVQAHGLVDRIVTLELYSQDSSQERSKDGIWSLEAEDRLTLGTDGVMLPVRFELTPDAPGRRTYQLRVVTPPTDQNASDNSQELDVEIVDRESRVLLLASGPTREYRFLRNQLKRDASIIVDVMLQSAPPGISQDADKILDRFPETKEELYQYDAIIAFDPDWTALELEQVGLIESWVAEEAGGMIVIAGPIHTGTWSRSSEMAQILDLYPVEFQPRFTFLQDSGYGSKVPWPVEFTRDGVEARFLRLEESPTENQAAWESFPGVYGYYAVKGPKSGATVYGRFSDPDAGLGDERPVYLAGHFYGSGRVFYIGSGEMWRLRELDDAYFERVYTKLIRHVSQGRLLRGSSKGVLLVERDRYTLGESVDLHAQLSNAQHEPLEADTVDVQITRPDRTSQLLHLDADKARKGMYRGHFTASQEGPHRIDLRVPETIDEWLTRRIQVRVPDLERQNPQRNDAVLSEIAAATGGIYYVGLSAALGDQGIAPLASQLRDKTQISKWTGAPDRQFEQRLSTWLLGAITGALSLEWLIRRLVQLA